MAPRAKARGGPLPVASGHPPTIRTDALPSPAQPLPPFRTLSPPGNPLIERRLDATWWGRSLAGTSSSSEGSMLRGRIDPWRRLPHRAKARCYPSSEIPRGTSHRAKARCHSPRSIGASPDDSNALRPPAQPLPPFRTLSPPGNPLIERRLDATWWGRSLAGTSSSSEGSMLRGRIDPWRRLPHRAKARCYPSSEIPRGTSHRAKARCHSPRSIGASPDDSNALRPLAHPLPLPHP